MFQLIMTQKCCALKQTLSTCGPLTSAHPSAPSLRLITPHLCTTCTTAILIRMRTLTLSGGKRTDVTVSHWIWFPLIRQFNLEKFDSGTAIMTKPWSGIHKWLLLQNYKNKVFFKTLIK